MKTAKKTPKLDLSATERAALRSNRIRLNELHDIDAQQLSVQLDISHQRAKELKTMAAFQRIPSFPKTHTSLKAIYSLSISSPSFICAAGWSS